MNCKTCKKLLASWNKTGFCSKCYLKSPQFLEYQKLKQREWYAKPENKLKKHRYVTSDKVRRRRKLYMNVYTIENIEHLRELKRNWERAHREERKDYRTKYLKQWRKKKNENRSK